MILPLVLCVAAPFAVLVGLRSLSRWHAGRQDPIDTLIRIPRWRVLARDAWDAWAAYYQALSEETIGLLRELR